MQLFRRSRRAVALAVTVAALGVGPVAAASAQAYTSDSGLVTSASTTRVAFNRAAPWQVSYGTPAKFYEPGQGWYTGSWGEVSAQVRPGHTRAAVDTKVSCPWYKAYSCSYQATNVVIYSF